jgi:uncharacterized protein
MQKVKFNILLVAIMVTLCNRVSSFPQEAISTEKKNLISEFRKLTGADTVKRSINFSSDNVQKLLSSIVEQDQEITDAQKIELRKSVTEATARVDQIMRDFLGDESQITELSENTIFQIYDKTFTESELKELIAFYGTPTGQKAARFLPGLSSQVQKDFGEVIRVKLDNLLRPKIQMEIEQLKKQIKDMKAKKAAN